MGLQVMKKKYMAPALETFHVEVQQMMALSLQGGKADDSDALVKGNDWDIFGSDFDDDADSGSFFED